MYGFFGEKNLDIGGGVSGSAKGGAGLRSGVSGPLSAPSTCRIGSCFCGVAGSLLQWLMGVSLPGEDHVFRPSLSC